MKAKKKLKGGDVKILLEVLKEKKDVLIKLKKKDGVMATSAK